MSAGETSEHYMSQRHVSIMLDSGEKKETGKKIRNPIRGVASQGWGWGN